MMGQVWQNILDFFFGTSQDRCPNLNEGTSCHVYSQIPRGVILSTVVMATFCSSFFFSIYIADYSKWNACYRIPGNPKHTSKSILITTQAKRNLSSRSGIGGVLSAT